MKQVGLFSFLKILMTLLLGIGILMFFMQNNNIAVQAGYGYTFVAPDDIVLGDMKFTNSPITGNSIGHLIVETPGTYNVTARDTKSSDTGYMVSGTNTLNHKLKIGPESDNLTDSDIEVLLLETSIDGDNTIPLFVSQEIDYDDPITNNYIITLTFTVIAQ